MYPRTVVLLLFIIMSFTLIQYYFFVPKGIKNTAKHSNQGYWSPSNADFDWCEYNYLLTTYIAEPWNTFTSLIYVFVSIVSMYFTSIYIPKDIYVLDVHLLTFVLILIGIGSTLFHATLRYETQLLDELPMHWLVCFSSIMLYTRDDYKLNQVYDPPKKHKNGHKINNGKNKKNTIKSSRNFYLNLMMAIFCGAITIILWTTEKESKIHQITRFFFAISFVGGFIYSFYCGAKIGNQVYEYRSNDANYRKVNEYYDKCFISFTVALIGWLCDNFYCQILQNLVISHFKIPYLHFHAILWHIGTCIGLHYFLLVILSHRVVFRYKKEIECTKICWGILPYIKIVDGKKSK